VRTGTRSWRRRLALTAVALGLATPEAAAAAEQDDKRSCVEASESAQRLRAEHDLVGARAQLVVCSASECPAVVQRYCGKWLTEVEAALPSVVIRIRDIGGQDVEGARVILDGAPWPEPTDGRVARLNPGPHTVGVQARGATTEQRVVVVEGEQNRVIEIKLPSPSAAAPASPQPRAAVIAEGGRSLSWVPPILGGLGVVALGGFAFFGITGADDLAGLHGGCGQTVSCRQGDVDDAVTKLRIADVALVSGVLLIGGALLATWLDHR
jgi:hypothetical protein